MAKRVVDAVAVDEPMIACKKSLEFMNTRYPYIPNIFSGT